MASHAMAFNFNAKLGAGFNSNMGKFYGSLTKSSQYLNQLSRSQQTVARNGQRMGNLFGGMAKGLLGMAAGYLTIQGLTSAYKDLTEVYKSSQIHETNFQTLMQKAPGATKPQLDALKQYADQQSKVGVVSKGVIKEGMAQLATFKLTAPQIQRLTGGMLDLAVRTHGMHVSQEQLQNTANQVGKVFTGQVGALRRAGISFNSYDEQLMKTGTQEQKVATLSKVLEANFGGVNSALAKTDSGRMILWENRLNAIKATMGEKLIPLQAQWMSLVISHMPQIQRFVENALKSISEWWRNNKTTFISLGKSMVSAFESAKPTLQWLFTVGLPTVLKIAGYLLEKFMAISNWVINNWKYIEPIVIGITVALAVYKTNLWLTNAAIQAGAIAQGEFLTATALATTGTNIATIAAGRLRLAMLALRTLGPIALVITASVIVGKYIADKIQHDITDVYSDAMKTDTKTNEMRRKQQADLLKMYTTSGLNRQAVRQELYNSGKISAKMDYAGQVMQERIYVKSHAKHYAHGGLITRQQLAWVGEGNRPELVLPLSNPPRTQQLIQSAGLGGSQITYAPVFNVNGAGKDAHEIAREVSAMTEQNFRRMFNQMVQRDQRTAFSS